MNRTRVVIQSRLSSSRLPGKALMTVAGMPLVELVARRASRSGHEVVVATSTEPYDDAIARHCATAGIAVVRGSLDDVLSRFVLATEDLDPLDRVVRLTGDNPIADAALVDELVTAVDASGHAYGRVDIERVPEGLGAEVFTAAALRQAHGATQDPYDREHVTPWLRRELGELLFVPVGSPTDVHAYRATVDTLHDFVRVTSVLDGVADPVGVPWQALMEGLVRLVDGLGPRVPHARSGPYSPLVLSARRFAAADAALPPDQHAEALRALVAEAHDRGVTHIDVGGAEGRSAELLRACTEPALSQRLSFVLRVALVAEAAAPPAATLSTAIERDLARLGRRRVDTLVLEDLPSGPGGEDAWGVARSYREAGVAARLGVVAGRSTSLARLAGLEGLDWVEVLPDTAPDDLGLVALRRRGATIAVDPGDVGAPPWADVRLLAAIDRAQLNLPVRAVAVDR